MPKPIKNISEITRRIFNSVAVKLCSFFGHRWLYKDYDDYIQADGSKYAFKASRNCQRCHQHGYYYTTWVIQDKAKNDYENDYYGIRKIEINKIVYS